MHDINIRGTFLLTKACLPHLRKSANPHVLTIAPPVNMNPYWLGAHPAYTLSKYGMTLLSLGWAAEFAEARADRVQLPVAGDLHRHGRGDEHGRRRPSSPRRRAAPRSWPTPPSRSSPGRPREVTGQCFIDADVLAAAGVTDLSRYGGGERPIRDLFLDAPAH